MLVAGCSTPISSLTNSDVEWVHEYLGVRPVLSTRAAQVLERFDAKDRNECVKLLLNENTFVVAHVLLTLSTHSKFDFDSREWNGLSITTDGKVDLTSTERKRAMVKRWQTAP